MAEETLERGSEGPEVADLQEKLIGLRFKPGEVDGKFGVITESALKMFQVSVKIEADGMVGERTRERLAEVLEQQNETAAG
ncbi:MAG: lysozyme [Solirubrobacteraceae bacterium]|jgi:peptidoglycan hydrolase-like protein with peptidoglycan-binding domain|nr:lysozyme [Solirubrobacteraceae bacterium]